ncbi:MAG: rod shape-determining protein MreC [Myxococcales bacterium]|nr:rod shape-determining protein MreC [Myxococcales bacterium]
MDKLKPHRTGIIFGLLTLAAVTMILSDSPERRLGPLDRAILALAAPLQKTFTAAGRRVSAAVEDYLGLVEVNRENEALRSIIAELRGALVAAREARIENERLRAMLGLRTHEPPDLYPASIIAEDSTGWFRRVRIDRGSEQGLRVGLAVVAPEGVVGQVTAVGRNTAEVLLVIDRNSAVPVVLQRSRSRGIATGEGGGHLSIEFVARADEVAEGDIVVTSGLGGVYPKGLSVGRVIHVDKPDAGLFQRVWIAPSVDFSRLEEVLVHIPSPLDEVDPAFAQGVGAGGDAPEPGS